MTELDDLAAVARRARMEADRLEGLVRLAGERGEHCRSRCHEQALLLERAAAAEDRARRLEAAASREQAWIDVFKRAAERPERRLEVLVKCGRSEDGWRLSRRRRG